MQEAYDMTDSPSLTVLNWFRISKSVINWSTKVAPFKLSSRVSNLEWSILDWVKWVFYSSWSYNFSFPSQNGGRFLINNSSNNSLNSYTLYSIFASLVWTDFKRLWLVITHLAQIINVVLSLTPMVWRFAVGTKLSKFMAF